MFFNHNCIIICWNIVSVIPWRWEGCGVVKFICGGRIVLCGAVTLLRTVDFPCGGASVLCCRESSVWS